MAASKNVTTRSRIRWSADKKTLYFDGRGLKVQNLTNFVGELLDLAEKIMSKHLLFQSDETIPEFDLSIVDDPSNHTAEHYFVHDKPDAWKHARRRMLNRLRASSQWHEMAEASGDGLNFHTHGVDMYKKWDTTFRELLAILIMISCGLSGRGTEMTSIRFMNCMDGDRNIYIEDGQIMIITEYHKSMALMDNIKVYFTYKHSL